MDSLQKNLNEPLENPKSIKKAGRPKTSWVWEFFIQKFATIMSNGALVDLLQPITSVSLTLDLWTARSQHGYLGTTQRALILISNTVFMKLL
ncbi:unnamed protein product [Rhizophagus irregularis]|nr:unnamed protein product [Rhizophagus irregularis]